VSNRGDFLFTVNKGINNSQTVLLFLLKLAQYLDTSKPGWRSNTVLMMDNAPYHRSIHLQSQLNELKLPIMFLGPYQFDLAPVERLFSFIKQRDLNPFKTIPSTRYVSFLLL
jgi:transposase